jgi:hypothetical protein
MECNAIKEKVRRGGYGICPTLLLIPTLNWEDGVKYHIPYLACHVKTVSNEAGGRCNSTYWLLQTRARSFYNGEQDDTFSLPACTLGAAYGVGYSDGFDVVSGTHNTFAEVESTHA